MQIRFSRTSNQVLFLSDMQFDYEIPPAEYVAAQMLFYRSYGKRRFVKHAVRSLLLGTFFVLIALFRWTEFGPLVLLLISAWFVCVGILGLFPRRYFRREYPNSGLPGRSYHAELDEIGFLVTGNSCSWRVLWTEAHPKGEDQRVFLFYAKGILFIFGKQYLSEAQQGDVRRLAGMD